MMFARALYYPWHDVRNPGWLKNACLYWDELWTLAPTDTPIPYRAKDARKLFDAGYLRPVPLHTVSDLASQAAQEFYSYTESPEWNSSFSQKELRKLEMVSREPTYRVSRESPYRLKRMEEPPNDQFKRRHGLRDDRVEVPNDTWIRAARPYLEEEALQPVRKPESLDRLEWTRNWDSSSRTLALYFTILASRLSERNGLALVTDKVGLKPLADSVRHNWPVSTPVTLGGTIPLPKVHPQITSTKNLAEALLAECVVQALKVSPDTPVERIIKFREQHQIELGRFRTAIRDLSRTLEDDYPSPEALKEAVRVLHQDQVKPAISELQGAVRGARLPAGLGILEVAAFTIPSTLLGAFATPIIISQPLLAAPLLVGAGVSLSLQFVKYRLSKGTKLSQNPYSYVLSMERALAK